MPVGLPKTKQKMKRLRNPDKYPQLKIVSFERIPSPGINSLTFKAVVKSEGRSANYISTVQFFDVEFSDSDKEGFESVKFGNKTIYYDPPSARQNKVRMKDTCFSGDTMIPLVNGTLVSIKDLVGEDHFFVYSHDRETNKKVVAKAKNCRLIESNAKLIEITFDNGHTIKCTPDHKFLLKTNKYIEAKDLTPDMSLEAVYRRPCPEDDYTKRLGYEQLLNTNGWEFTHVISDEYNLEESVYTKDRGSVRHHIDFNKFNNNPTNIQRVSFREHRKIHNELWKNNHPMKDPVIVSKVRQKNIENGSYKRKSEQMKLNNPMHNSESVKKAVSTNRSRGNYSREVMSKKSPKLGHPVFDKISKTQKELIKNGEQVGLNKMIEVTRERCNKGTHHTQSQEWKDQTSKRSELLVKEGNLSFQRKDVRDATSKRNSKLLKDPLEQEKRIRGRAIKALKNHILEFGMFVENKFNPGKGYPSLKSIKKRFNLEKLLLEATNHKILSIREMPSEDVYCFTVEKYGNFMIDLGEGQFGSGVIVKNCEDFRFTWEKQLFDKKGLIGNWRRYKRKTPPPPRGRPFRNPDKVEGYCKHIKSLLEALRKARMIKR